MAQDMIQVYRESWDGQRHSMMRATARQDKDGKRWNMSCIGDFMESFYETVDDPDIAINDYVSKYKVMIAKRLERFT